MRLQTMDAGGGRWREGLKPDVGMGVFLMPITRIYRKTDCGCDSYRRKAGRMRDSGAWSPGEQHRAMHRTRRKFQVVSILLRSSARTEPTTCAPSTALTAPLGSKFRGQGRGCGRATKVSRVHGYQERRLRTRDRGAMGFW